MPRRDYVSYVLLSSLFTFCISVTWIGQVKYLSIRYFLCQYLFISCCFIKNTAPLHWAVFVHLCQLIILYLSCSSLASCLQRKSMESWRKTSKYVCIFCILLDWRSVGCEMMASWSWILYDDFSEQTFPVITTCAAVNLLLTFEDE